MYLVEFNSEAGFSVLKGFKLLIKPWQIKTCSDCLLFVWITADGIFQGTDPFHLDDQICGHE